MLILFNLQFSSSYFLNTIASLFQNPRLFCIFLKPIIKHWISSPNALYVPFEVDMLCIWYFGSNVNDTLINSLNVSFHFHLTTCLKINVTVMNTLWAQNSWGWVQSVGIKTLENSFMFHRSHRQIQVKQIWALQQLKKRQWLFKTARNDVTIYSSSDCNEETVFYHGSKVSKA